MTILDRVHAKLGDLWWYTALLFVAQRLGDAVNMVLGLWLVPKYVPMQELGAVLPLSSEYTRFSSSVRLFCVRKTGSTIRIEFSVASNVGLAALP